MKSNILPHKLLIEFNKDGTFSDGILMYRIKEDSGQTIQKYQTISIKSEINIPIINGIIQKVIKFTKKQEGINA
jgi:hypothetical protein